MTVSLSPEQELESWGYQEIDGPFQISDLKDEYLIDRNELRSYGREVGRYYPSEISSCFRKQWYAWMFPDMAKITDPITLGIFFMGNMIEDHVVTEILETKFGHEWTKREGPIAVSFADLPGVCVSGRWDFFIVNKKDRTMIELKSQNGYAKRRTFPKPDHVLQITPYMFAEQERFTLSSIQYVSKNDLEMSPTFWTPYLPLAWDYFSWRVHKIHGHVMENTVPEAEARCNPSKKWLCVAKYCPFARMCKAKEKELKDLMNDKQGKL